MSRNISKHIPSLLRCAAMAIAAILMAGALTACGGLSDREKSMVGKYYIPVLSDTNPLIELNADGTSTLRAIQPGEITYCVAGQWHLKGDSLIIVNDSTSITIEDGDPGLVGHVAPRVAWPVKSFNESTLTLERSGITYDYHRRFE